MRNWTEEQKEEVYRLWNEGHDASAIAGMIKRKATRSAVRGIIVRGEEKGIELRSADGLNLRPVKPVDIPEPELTQEEIEQQHREDAFDLYLLSCRSGNDTSLPFEFEDIAEHLGVDLATITQRYDGIIAEYRASELTVAKAA